MKYQLTEKEVAAIEKVINRSGITEAVVQVKNGEIIVLQQEKRKIV